MTKSSPDYFTKELAEHYDEKNKKLSAISHSLHFLTGLVLQDLPSNAKILSVGAGTGAEVLYLAKVFPNWTFLTVEPSLSMLKVCQEKIQEAGLIERCEFIHGYAQDAPLTETYDAALAILVAHFIKHKERKAFYKNLMDRLKPNGYLVNAEISFDLQSKEFPMILKNWEEVQKLMGASPESLNSLPEQLKNTLTVLPGHETESLIKSAGFNLPIRFFQVFMISAWYAVK